MKDNFYSCFEHKHRGSRESIKRCLNSYMPFIYPLIDVYQGHNIIDLGCGRGEWLEIMKSLGFNARGVDINEDMISHCRNIGLNVIQGDVIAFLEGIADESVAIVSSFHLVEHVKFDIIKRLVSESFRILKAGGLLIIETPNPENIIVATNNFYLDPTHKSPIPSSLLSFLVEHEGFHRNKILRLQEDKSLISKQDIQIIDILGGVSPDYSVVAQKKGKLAIVALLDSAFEINYGVGLEELSKKYHRKISNLSHAIERLNNLVNKENAELKTSVLNIYSSRSWRITSPLRALSRKKQLWINFCKKNEFHKFLLIPKNYFYKKFILFLKGFINLVNRKQKLKILILKIINKIGCYSYIYKLLHNFYRQNISYNSQKKISETEEKLSPKASAIYKILKNKISNNVIRKD